MVEGLDTALASKANSSDMATALGLKADASAMTAALGLKADASALAAKADASAMLYDWHPYNKTAVNDANDGLIWSFAANGAVAEVVTPNFVDGFEYMIVLDRVLNSSNGNIRVDIYRETSAAYAGATTISTSTTSVPVSGVIEITRPRAVSKQHQIFARTEGDASDSVAAQTPTFIVAKHTTAQKLLRARLNMNTGNITGSGGVGAIYLYKRRLLT